MSTWERIFVAYFVGVVTLPALATAVLWYDARERREARAKERKEEAGE